MTTFTFPLSFPATVPNPTAVSIRRMSAVVLDINDFTFDQLVYEWPGQMWGASFSYAPMDRSTAEDLLAVFLKCNGSKGSFLLGDPGSATPRGIGTGTPLVKGAGQTGNDLITDGWTISQTGILKVGDWIQLENHLYKVLIDANSDGSGNATFTIWPNLRSAPADNAALTVISAKGKFRLTTSEGELTLNNAILYGLNLEAIEALP